MPASNAEKFKLGHYRQPFCFAERHEFLLECPVLQRLP
jgi:hypothetical protein